MSLAKDPLRYFRIESREISEQLARGVLQLEKEVTPDAIAHLLRLAHTLKGAAGVVKQRDIAQIAHNLEDALAPFSARAIPFPAEEVDHILSLVDAMSAHIAALEPAQPADRDPSPPPEDQAHPLRYDAAELDLLLRGLAEANMQVQTLRHTVEQAQQAAQLASHLFADRPQMAGAAAERVDDRYGELRHLLAGVEDSLRNGLDQTERNMYQAYATAEGLRLLSCDATFATLERAVRDAAKALGKNVTFVAKGGDIRLDAQVLNVVQRALVQIVRNAVVHGIEDNLERERMGKPKYGVVAVEIHRRGERVAFLCRDDGRGIDLDALEKAARARGTVAALPQGPDALVRLLLQGGLTTARAVSELSGRGIGMDIVREVAQRLGGELAARTEAGRGTVIELVVPVSLSALDALLVEADGSVAALPLKAVQTTLRLAPRDIARTAEGDTIVHDGRTMPFLGLSRLLGSRGADTARTGSRSAVVLQAADAHVAIGVDRLLGGASIVARSVPPLAFAEAAVSGVSLNAEGVPQLVLDPEGLVRSAQRAGGRRSIAVKKPLPVLVIDDSLTTRVLEQSILETAGYEVDLASSAEEGLEKARRRKYGLFLVDVEMPGMDGFAFVEITRADAALCAVPAILVTSRNAPADRQRAIEVGASAYIVKGEFDQGRVLEIIHRLLG